MAFPDNLMADGERVVLHKHPHWKVLVLPGLAFVVIIAAASFLIAWVGRWDDTGLTTHRWWYVGIGVVGAVLLVLACGVPFLRWRCEHFVLTTAHVFFRTGILSRRLHQIPLVRVQNVETIVSFWGRIFRFGSLIVESAADEPLEFSNVAAIDTVQGTLNRLIAADRTGYLDPDDPRSGAFLRPTIIADPSDTAGSPP